MLSYDAVESKNNFSQIEKVVLRTKKEWEAIFDAIPDMLILTNSEGRISRCNQATTKTFHSKYGDLIGRVFTEFFPEARGANAAGIDIQLFEDRHWYRVYAIPVQTGGEQKNHVYLFQDISKRKGYELEILKEEQYYEALFQSNPASLAVLDLNRKIRHVNPAFEKAFGYTQPEAKGQKIEKILSSGESGFANDAPLGEAKPGNGTRILHCRKKDGSTIDVALDELPVKLNGIDHGRLVTLHTSPVMEAAPHKPDPFTRSTNDLMEKLDDRLRPAVDSILELIAMLDGLHLTPDQYEQLMAAKENASSLLEIMVESRNLVALNHNETGQRSAAPARTMRQSPEILSSPLNFASPKGMPHKKLQLLLVEDNPINQKLVLRLLQKAGHLVQVADNGNTALQMLRKRSFDLVLMDIQMPEMDGIETTRQIRLHEREGQHQVIVAMTAEGPLGDRQKCLKAGMDDFLAKPLDIDRLFMLLDKYSPEASPNEVNEASETNPLADEDDDLLDINVALPRFGGEITVYFDFLARFIQQLRQTDQKLREAYKNGDVQQLHALSHGLKGTAANFEAIAIRDAASSLEELTGNNSLVGAYMLINDISHQIPLIEAFYNKHTLVQKNAPAPNLHNVNSAIK